jgi:hypothetical protein
MNNNDWATEELELWLINDESMYRRMNTILNEEVNPYTAARRLREEFSSVESMGEPIGKIADYVQIVRSQTRPEDWVNEDDLWGEIDDTQDS